MLRRATDFPLQIAALPILGRGAGTLSLDKASDLFAGIRLRGDCVLASER